MSTGTSFSHYVEGMIISSLLRAGTWTTPAGLYLALYTTAPTDSGGGTEVSTTSTGYARVSIATTNFSAASAQSSGSTTSNSVQINFPTPTASWGTVVAIGILDASSGGNLLLWGNLSASQTISSGATVNFPVGNLTFLVD